MGETPKRAVKNTAFLHENDKKGPLLMGKWHVLEDFVYDEYIGQDTHIVYYVLFAWRIPAWNPGFWGGEGEGGQRVRTGYIPDRLNRGNGVCGNRKPVGAGLPWRHYVPVALNYLQPLTMGPNARGRIARAAL